MKKLLLFASSLLLSGVFVQAQEIHLPQATLTIGVDVEGTFPHFSSLTIGDGAANVTHFRLTSKTYAKHDGTSFVAVDSTTYKYGYGRGGDVTVEEPNIDQEILFDESYTYQYVPVTDMYINKLKRTQQFNADDKVTNLTYSSWSSHNYTFRDSMRYLYAYDAKGKMDLSVAQTWLGTIWANDISSDIKYNSNDKIIKMTSKVYDIEFVYNSAGDIEQTIDMQVKNGKLTLNERKKYTYNNGEIETYELENWDDIKKDWVKTKKWEYNYLSGSELQEHIEYNWNGTGWLAYGRYYYYYDATQNNVLVERRWQKYYHSQNKFINERTQHWYYNSNNQPTRMTSMTWDEQAGKFVSTAGDEQIRFHYEYYNPTSVKNINLLNTNVRTYPSPAGSYVNVAVKWNRAQDFDITLYDMSGRVVYQAHIANKLQYEHTITVANLPSGGYFIKVNGADAQLTDRIIVTH